MPRNARPAPGWLAKAVSSEIRAEIARQRVSIEHASRFLSFGDEYLGRALRDMYALTVDDVDQVAKALGIDPATLIRHAIEHASALSNREKALAEKPARTSPKGSMPRKTG